MSTAKQAAGAANATDAQNVRETPAGEAAAAAPAAAVAAQPAPGAFKRGMSKVLSMWAYAAVAAGGAALGVGGTILVQKRINRTAVGSGSETPMIGHE